LRANLPDPVHGFLRGAKYFIHDRGPLFTEAFGAILRSSGVPSVKTPAKSPNFNPHAVRFVKTIRYECLNHLVLFGERHLRHVISEFVEHYLGERFHQGVDGQLVKERAGFAETAGQTGDQPSVEGLKAGPGHGAPKDDDLLAQDKVLAEE
jgi:hypothetical protein